MTVSVYILWHFISTFFQAASIKSGSYGGGSGQDSIWRAVAGCMDQTVGLGFLLGLWTQIYPDTPEFLRLAIWDQLHTRQNQKAHEMILSTRTLIPKWRRFPLPFVSNAMQRKIMVTLQEGTRCFNALPQLKSNLVAIEFTPNLSQSFIPYVFLADPSTREIHVTKRSLHKTVARTLARFAICLTSLLLLFTFRIVLITLFLPRGLGKWILYAGELGRVIMICMQESSIMTYSCAYMCAETWASQGIMSLPRWTATEQEQFTRDVIEFLGYAFHARIFFWTVDKFWRLMARFSGRWEEKLGASMSATFTCPKAQDDGKFEDTVSFRLHVLALQPATTCNTLSILTTMSA
ncbi:hypothetical protein C8F01DRAFT_1228355 [Mycena amicta]|nr:hypothetical protein C8F01DRAFT_1228355 [Mycena amicta]